MKQQSSDSNPSISNSAIMDLITQSLSSQSFILLFFSRSLPKACNYRVRCKTRGWASICLSLISYSSQTHTLISVCGGLTQGLIENTWSSNMYRPATSVWVHKCISLHVCVCMGILVSKWIVCILVHVYVQSDLFTSLIIIIVNTDITWLLRTSHTSTGCTESVFLCVVCRF